MGLFRKRRHVKLTNNINSDKCCYPQITNNPRYARSQKAISSQPSINRNPSLNSVDCSSAISSSKVDDSCSSTSTESICQILPNTPLTIGRPSATFEPRIIDTEKFKSLPLRTDTVIDGWESDWLNVRAASIRGASHRYYGSPRQDDFAISVLNNGWVVAAVADGVSSAINAHIGSSEALRYLVGWFEAKSPSRIEDVDWDNLVRSIAWHLVETEKRMFPQVSSDKPGWSLATTLACTIVTQPYSKSPSVISSDVAAFSIGDSSVWLLNTNGYENIIGGKCLDIEGVASSSVSALPIVPERIHPYITELRSDEVLLLGTDGFGDPLGDGSGEVGELFRTSLMQATFPSIIAFGYMLDFSRETFDDDRTLIALRLISQSAEQEDEITFTTSSSE